MVKCVLGKVLEFNIRLQACSYACARENCCKQGDKIEIDDTNGTMKYGTK